MMINGITNYKFSTSSGQAYGNNLIQVDNSPVRFANYSGDMNQDGIVDATDILLIFNDAAASVSGYVPSDINGDNVTDASDILLAFSNATAIVTLIRP